MNLLLSKRGDYVVRSALSLARVYDSGSHRKIREVVAEMGVPQTYASQILTDLVRTGIAESKSGKEGGYRLTKAPSKIKMLEIVEAGEGPLKAEHCSLGDGPCRWDSVCPLHEIWYSATTAMRKVLEETTLQDLLEKDLSLESGNSIVSDTTHRKVSKNIPVSDWIQIEKGVNEVVDAVCSEASLTQLMQKSFSDIDSLRISLDGMLPSWEPSKLDCVVGEASTDVVKNHYKNDKYISNQSSSQNVKTVGVKDHSSRYQPDTKTDNLARYFSISFEAVTISNLNIHADLVGKVLAVDSDRSEFHLRGNLRIPDHGESAHDDAQNKLSNAFIRALLRKFAENLESE